jgi:hypothetical protein
MTKRITVPAMIVDRTTFKFHPANGYWTGLANVGEQIYKWGCQADGSHSFWVSKKEGETALASAGFASRK